MQTSSLCSVPDVNSLRRAAKVDARCLLVEGADHAARCRILPARLYQGSADPCVLRLLRPAGGLRQSRMGLRSSEDIFPSRVSKSWSSCFQKRPLWNGPTALIFLFVVTLLAYKAGQSSSMAVGTGSFRSSIAAVAGQGSLLKPKPFYVTPDASVFRKMAFAMNRTTYKVGATAVPDLPNLQHTYNTLYSKYFERDDQRFSKLKFLEIGLGCNMHYGPGASAELWKGYLPNAEIWFAEYDVACVQRHADKLKEIRVHVVTGDQGDNATLARWLQETGGGFDVIVDDGGHFNHHIYNSFATLFHQALKPGGVYFIEDLQVARQALYRGPAAGAIVPDVIKDWIESIMSAITFGKLSDLSDPVAMKPAIPTHDGHRKSMLTSGDAAYVPIWKLPVGVKLIECAAEMCAIVKCTADDRWCPNGM